MSDEEILQLSYNKPTRFSELFDRYHKRFMLVAKKDLRSKDDAEDAVQEAFVRIYKYGKKFPENGGRFEPWANTILKHCITDQINKYKKAPVALTEEMEAVLPSQEETDDKSSKEYSDYVKMALSKLSGATAEIFKLRFILGKSFKEIGKILKIKSGTARVRVFRSKKLFIQAYKQFHQHE